MSSPVPPRHFAGSPHVVAAVLISLVLELGCQLRSIDDFGVSVTFAPPAPLGTRGEVLVAHVTAEGDGSAVTLRPLTTDAGVTDGVLSGARVLDALALRLVGA